MAIVPLAENKVQEQGLPNIRSSGNVPLSALGGGQSAEQVTNSQLALNDSIQKEILAQKQKADQMVHVQFQGKMANLEAEMLYGENGHMQKRGEDAMNSVVPTLENFKKSSQELIDSLPTDSQRRNAFLQATQNFDQVQKQVMGHSAVESEKVFDESHKSTVNNLSNLAIMSNDPSTIDIANAEIKNILNEYADKKGYPGGLSIDQSTGKISITGEARILLLSETQSKLFAGVVDNKIKLGQYDSAQSYYSQKLNMILPDDRQRLSGGLKEGALRYKAQVLSDEIFNKYPLMGTKVPGGGDSTAQSEIDAIASKDPELGKILNESLDYRYAKRAKQILEVEQEKYKNAHSQAEANPGAPAMLSVTADVWKDLSDSEKRSCELAASPPKTDNEKLFLEYTALSPLKMAQMDPVTYTKKYRDPMSPATRNEMDAIRNGAIEAINTPDKTDRSVADESLKSMVIDIAGTSGLIPKGSTYQTVKDDDAKVSALFDLRMASQRQIEYEQNRLNRKLSTREAEDIIRPLAAKRMVNTPHWFGRKNTMEEGPAVYEGMTPFDEIDPVMLLKYENFLKSKGNPNPTKSQIEILNSLSKVQK